MHSTDDNEKKYFSKSAGIVIASLIGILITLCVWSVNTAWSKYDNIATKTFELQRLSETRDLVQDNQIEGLDARATRLENAYIETGKAIQQIRDFMIIEESKHGK